MRKKGMPVDVEAADATPEAIVKALVKHFGKHEPRA